MYKIERLETDADAELYLFTHMESKIEKTIGMAELMSFLNIYMPYERAVKVRDYLLEFQVIFLTSKGKIFKPKNKSYDMLILALRECQFEKNTETLRAFDEAVNKSFDNILQAMEREDERES